MSEETLLLEVMRKEFQQITGVVLVIVMDVGEEVVQRKPSANPVLSA